MPENSETMNNSLEDFPRSQEDSSLANTQPLKPSRKAALTGEQSESSLADTQPVKAAGKVHTTSAQLAESLAPTQPVHVYQPPAVQLSRPGEPSAEKTQPIRVARRSGIWHDAWRRLLRSPEGVIGMVIILLFILVAIFADGIAPYPVREVHIKDMNLPPFWVELSKQGTTGKVAFPLGTDRMGRDLLSWAISGTRSSLLLGLISAPIIALMGTLLGLIAGYFGGWVDNLLMRITDVFYSFPTLMICILVVLSLRDTVIGKFENGFFLLIIAFLAVGWAGAARLVRGSVLAIKDTEYIEAARAIGVPTYRLIFKHILPNCLSPLLVWITLMVPQLILTEAVLGYLQINLGPPGYREGFFDSSWGGMIREGRSFIHVQPFTIMIPAICVGLVSIAFTFLGDALRDALDPQNHGAKSRDG